MMFRTFRLLREAIQWRNLCLAEGFDVDGPFLSPRGWSLTWYVPRPKA